MKTAGIVAEFNPFHNGHAALVQAAREEGATHVAAVMSGNFVQRGTPAVTDKRIRTKCALMGGVDLVLELPVAQATAAAHYFAGGAVDILAAAGCVDMLCFGSESGEIDALQELALTLEDPAVNAALAEALADGVTFARARQLAVGKLQGEKMASALAFPNNALAVEYLRAVRRTGWCPELFTMARVGAAHDAPAPAGDGLASGSYLRGIAGDFPALRRYMPEVCVNILEDAQSQGLYAANGAKLETAVLARLRGLTRQQLRLLPDVSEGLENRLYDAVRDSVTVAEVYERTKSKRYTLARIRRLVLHAFLGITAVDVRSPPPYIRVLGFNTAGRELLARMSRTASLPVDTRLARLRARGGSCAHFARLEEHTTDLYTLALPIPRPCGYELSACGVFLK